MPKKNAISFEVAIQRLSDAQTESFKARRIGNDPDQYHWFASHFVEWISDLGFHIELSGDEFDLYSLPKKVS